MTWQASIKILRTKNNSINKQENTNHKIKISENLEKGNVIASFDNGYQYRTIDETVFVVLSQVQQNG